MDTQLLAAKTYRDLESGVKDMMVNQVRIETSATLTESFSSRQLRYHVNTIQASLATREMSRLKDKFNLLVGGDSGVFKNGSIVSFNPRIHIVKVEDNEDLPERSDEIIVEKSQIRGKNGKSSKLLLDAEFKLPSRLPTGHMANGIILKDFQNTIPKAPSFLKLA